MEVGRRLLEGASLEILGEAANRWRRRSVAHGRWPTAKVMASLEPPLGSTNAE